MKRPDDVWRPSPRQYPPRVEPFEYPGDLLVRVVRTDGSIKLVGDMVFLSEVLAGEKVGLEPTEDGGWVLHVGPLAIAIVTCAGSGVTHGPGRTEVATLPPRPIPA